MNAVLRSTAMSAACLAILGGCAIGPDYARPEAAEPPSYRIDAGVLTVAADSDWWNSFNDPVLTAMVEAALRSNYDVRIAAARIDTISYGKERPICTESNESCWAQNRRGVTTITAGANS